MKFFADANSADPKGAAPYLSLEVSKSCFVHGRMEVARTKCTYHAITAIPRKALTQLNTSATIPLAVKPDGKGATLLF